MNTELMELQNKVAELERQVNYWNHRYLNTNRMCNARADERVHIIKQLNKIDLNLDGDGNLTRFNSASGD